VLALQRIASGFAQILADFLTRFYEMLRRKFSASLVTTPPVEDELDYYSTGVVYPTPPPRFPIFLWLKGSPFIPLAMPFPVRNCQ
jgi:hypothetical protein